jgi:hypothetical protein
LILFVDMEECLLKALLLLLEISTNQKQCSTLFQDDGYIPRHSVVELQKAWPGSEVRWVTGGHVSSFFLHNDAFRKAIVDGLDRL